MTKVRKENKEKILEQTRMRVRIHRGMKAILNKESKVSESNSFVNPEFKPGSSIITNGILNTQWRSDFVKDIRKWALDFNITKRAVTSLLKTLHSKGMHFFPTDSRALLKTPRSIETLSVAGGNYWHNGMRKCIEKILSDINQDILIEININVDGLPLFKSSKVEFWPILANIHGMREIKPFIIGIWSGDGKPKCLREYLGPLIEEVHSIYEHKIMINGYQITVKIRCFLCDTPARCLLKGITSK